MKLTLLNKLGDGAFADVWNAKDELDRNVAVKIIRPANVGVSDALAHAKALARAEHQNVVSVISLEKIQDPESGEIVDCVVMELISGITLSARLTKNPLDAADVIAIGVGIINGLDHIHSKNLVHGDLHSENVMIVDDTPKIIDILYRSSLTLLSTEKKESSIKKDFSDLRSLLTQLLNHSTLTQIDITRFNILLDTPSTFDEFRAALHKVIDNVINKDGTHIDLKTNLQNSLKHPSRSQYVHPSFFDVANNLAADEVGILSAMYKFDLAPIIKIRALPQKQVIHYNITELVYTDFFDSTCEYQQLISAYLINLERLGLIRTSHAVDLLMPNVYKQMLLKPLVRDFINSFTEHISLEPEIEKYYVKLTSFGYQFCNVALRH